MDLSTMSRAQITLMGSGLCVMLTMNFTMRLLQQHLFYWKNPKEQKAIIIIILMAPIYAVDSFVGLLDIKGSKPFFTFLDSVKECYEALVIAKFMALMYSYLKISISKNIVPDEIKGREFHHSFPMTLFQLYVYVYELNTLFSNIAATHCPPGSPYIEAPQILDVAVCCYPPNMFHIDDYTATSSDISLLVELDIYNHSKRFSFIGIVLFGGLLPCFCKRVGTPQTARKVHDVVLEILAGMGIIRSHHFWLDVEHINEAIQNVLVCLEMVVFSIIQQYAYPATPYSGDVEAKLKLNKKTE
ncbi:hypothetical protein WN943_012365 [Citrus x changshan-huyou]